MALAHDFKDDDGDDGAKTYLKDGDTRDSLALQPRTLRDCALPLRIFYSGPSLLQTRLFPVCSLRTFRSEALRLRTASTAWGRQTEALLN